MWSLPWATGTLLSFVPVAMTTGTNDNNDLTTSIKACKCDLPQIQASLPSRVKSNLAAKKQNFFTNY